MKKALPLKYCVPAGHGSSKRTVNEQVADSLNAQICAAVKGPADGAGVGVGVGVGVVSVGTGVELGTGVGAGGVVESEPRKQPPIPRLRS